MFCGMSIPRKGCLCDKRDIIIKNEGLVSFNFQFLEAEYCIGRNAHTDIRAENTDKIILVLSSIKM